ncbi:hypothetical protein Tco_0358793, partial [Tanacetum coccineum]
ADNNNQTHPLRFKYPNAPYVGGWVEMAMRMALLVDGGDDVSGGCAVVVSRGVMVMVVMASLVWRGGCDDDVEMEMMARLM